MKNESSKGIIPIAVAKGNNGQVELYKDKIRVTRKGLWAKITQFGVGDREVRISDLSSVEFKKGGLLDGHVRFTYPGSSEKSAALACDPDQVQFGSRARKDFERIVNLIEQRRDQLSEPSAPLPTNNLDEIEKLAGLHSRGILTDEEFSAKKAQLLAG
jgi:hypothetical protein